MPNVKLATATGSASSSAILSAQWSSSSTIGGLGAG